MSEHRPRKLSKGLQMTDRNDVIFDMKSMLKRFNIDSDQWVGKNFKEKLAYLKKRMRSNDKIELAESGSKLLDAVFYTLRNASESRIAHKYIGLAQTAFNLFRINFIVKNAFVAEQYEYRGRFDAMAQVIGEDNDCSLTVAEVKTSGDMCRYLLNMSQADQEKYDIHFKKIKNLLRDDDDEEEGYRLRSAVLFSHAGHDFVMQLENYAASKADLGKDHEDYMESSYADVRVAMRNEDYDEEIITDAVHTLYTAYLGNVDLSKYMFEMDNVFFSKFKREIVDFDVCNLDVARMRRAISKTLEHDKSRSFLVEGEPGVGKTMSIEKVLEGVQEYPVFWVPLEAIQEACIDQTFQTLARIDKSIIVFDDIDGIDMSEKNEYATDFMGYLDELRDTSSGHIIIIIVNEPQKLHHMFRSRPGRIDEVIVVTAPKTAEDVFDVIKQRFRHENVAMPKWASLGNKQFRKACEDLAKKGITQAYITGIISDLVTFYDGDHSFKNFKDSVRSAMESRDNSMLVAGSDGRLCSAQTVQQTATASQDAGT